MWDKLSSAAHNSLCGSRQRWWLVLLQPRFPKGVHRAQAVWAGMADLEQSTRLPGYSLPAKSGNIYCKQIINPRKYLFCILSTWLLNRIVKIWTKPLKTNLNPWLVYFNSGYWFYWLCFLVSPLHSYPIPTWKHFWTENCSCWSLFQRVSSLVPTSPLAKFCLLFGSE